MLGCKHLPDLFVSGLVDHNFGNARLGFCNLASVLDFLDMFPDGLVVIPPEGRDDVS